MTYKKLIIIVLILLAAFAGFLAYRSYSTNKTYETDTTNKSNRTYRTDTTNTSNKTDAVSAPSSESGIYNNPDHNFSLQLLPGLSTNAFEEGDGDVVLIGQDRSYKTDTSYKSYEMQITIRPFDEETSLTAARIQKEVPEIKMQNAVVVKADGTDAISFVDGADNTRQIWFVQNRELYQIIASPQYDNVTGRLMESWKWE